MLNICWQSYHLCLKILAVVSLFWNSYINFILYLIQSWTKNSWGHLYIIQFFEDIQVPSSPPHLSMLCCCERDEQTSSRIMSDYNIDLGEWGVSSVPSSKIVLRRVKKLPINLTKMLITLKTTQANAVIFSVTTSVLPQL